MSVVVVKVGGAVAASSAAVVLELAAENRVCVVHGAGPQISAEMERAGIAVEFVNGLRVTTPAGLEIVRLSFEAVNTGLCAAIGDRAVPFFGYEVGFEAEPIENLGRVGEPEPQDVPAVARVLGAGLIPVFAPLAIEPGTGLLNVNADDAAAALAAGLLADELRILTDVDGFIVDGEVLDWIDYNDAVKLLQGGTLKGGIVPKLRAALTAAELGVRAFIGRTEIEPVPMSAGVPLG